MTGFLTSDDIEKRVNKGELIEKVTFKKNLLRTVMYDLRLGEEVLVTPQKKPIILEENEVLSIESGQFALLTTEEYLKIPNDVFAFITIRFGYKGKGLVNISGFHVDPGFEGKLVFSVYNVGPTTITLRRKEPVFSIFFYELPKHVGPKKRKFLHIPLPLIESLAGARVPSLERLEQSVNRNWTYIKVYGTILTGLFVAILVAVLRAII